MFDTFFWVSSQLSESGPIYICYFCTINPYIFDLGTTSDIFLGELSLSTDFTIKFCQNSDWISPLATSPKCNEANPSLYTDTTADHNSSSSEDSLLDLMEGSFHLHSSDNFDSYLEELGVGYILRQLAALAFPIITVSGCPAPSSPPPPAPSPCRWSIQTDAGLRSHVITFLPGEGVQDTTMDGRQVGYSRF